MAGFVNSLRKDGYEDVTRKAVELYEKACANLEARHQGEDVALGGDDILPEICRLLEPELWKIDLCNRKLYEELDNKANAWCPDDPLDMARCAPVQAAFIAQMEECRHYQSQLSQLKSACGDLMRELNIVITREMFDDMEKTNFEEDYTENPVLDAAMLQQELIGNLLTMMEDVNKSPIERVKMFSVLYNENRDNIAIGKDVSTHRFLQAVDHIFGLAPDKQTMLTHLWKRAQDSSLVKKAQDSAVAKKLDEILHKKFNKP